ncbi:MAG: hypothetical protein WKI46_05655 [Aquificaceae bacterium]
MKFLTQEELIRYVSEGIASVGGERAYKTFYRLWQELKGVHPVVAIERVVSYAFDSAGHVLINHIRRRIAKEKCESVSHVPLQEGVLFVELANCPVHELSQELRPTEAVVCSLCRGFMETLGENMKLGHLKEVSYIEGRCTFVYGGVAYGHDKLQAQGAGA